MVGGRRTDGAGAGIGGNGGKGGNANKTQDALKGHNMEFVAESRKDGSNPNNNTNASFDGENGENCGIVKIQNDVKVYAYGGKGGSGGNGVNSSGGGRWRIPCSWYWTEVGLGRRTEQCIMMVQEVIQAVGAEGNTKNGINGNGGGVSGGKAGSGGRRILYLWKWSCSRY